MARDCFIAKKVIFPTLTSDKSLHTFALSMYVNTSTVLGQQGDRDVTSD